MLAARRGTEFANGGTNRTKSMYKDTMTNGDHLIIDEDEDDGEEDVLGFGAAPERR